MLKLVAAGNVPDPDAALRNMRREASELEARYPAIHACRFELRRDAPAGFEAHVELLLPQHQLIVNALADAPQRALDEALAKVSRQLAGIARRDPSLAG